LVTLLRWRLDGSVRRPATRLVILSAAATAIVHGSDELVLRPDFAEPMVWRVSVALILAAVAVLVVAVTGHPTAHGGTSKVVLGLVGVAGFIGGLAGVVHEGGADMTGIAAVIGGAALLGLVAAEWLTGEVRAEYATAVPAPTHPRA
jgi:hypothetical protein